jgi:hypothetical protein
MSTQILSGGVTNANEQVEVLKSNTEGLYKVSPANIYGISGFLFSIPLKSGIRRKAEITDHYLEDNTFINDHIGIKPRVIELTGLVGESIVENNLDVLGQTAQQVETRLTPIVTFFDELTDYEQQLQNILSTEVSPENIEAKLDLFSIFKNLSPFSSLQQRAYAYFESIMLSNYPVIVDTPYGIYNDMYIESIDGNQDEDTTTVSDFKITLKQMRFSELETVTIDLSKFASGKAKTTNTPEKNKGKNKGTETDSSLLFDLGSFIFSND